MTDWRTLPAFSLSSRSHVVLKIASIDESSESEEIEVYRLLTRAPYVNDPRNPIVKETRIVTLRDDEDEALVTLLVMPLLTPVCSTRFHTHASRFEFARQLINVRLMWTSEAWTYPLFVGSCLSPRCGHMSWVRRHELHAIPPLRFFSNQIISATFTYQICSCPTRAHRSRSTSLTSISPDEKTIVRAW